MSKKSHEKKLARENKRKKANLANEQKLSDRRQAMDSLFQLRFEGLNHVNQLADVLLGFAPKSKLAPADPRVEELLDSTQLRGFINSIEKALFSATRSGLRDLTMGYSFLSTSTEGGAIWSASAPVVFEEGDYLDYHVLQNRLDADPEAILAVWVVEILLPTGARFAQCLTRDGHRQTYALANGQWLPLGYLKTLYPIVEEMGGLADHWDTSNALELLIHGDGHPPPLEWVNDEDSTEEYDLKWQERARAVAHPLRLAQSDVHYEMVSLALLRDKELPALRAELAKAKEDAKAQAQRESQKEVAVLRRNVEDLERRLAWAVKKAQGATPAPRAKDAGAAAATPQPAAAPLQSRLRQIFG